MEVTINNQIYSFPLEAKDEVYMFSSLYPITLPNNLGEYFPEYYEFFLTGDIEPEHILALIDIASFLGDKPSKKVLLKGLTQILNENKEFTFTPSKSRLLLVGKVTYFNKPLPTDGDVKTLKDSSFSKGYSEKMYIYEGNIYQTPNYLALENNKLVSKGIGPSISNLMVTIPWSIIPSFGSEDYDPKDFKLVEIQQFDKSKPFYALIPATYTKKIIMGERLRNLEAFDYETMEDFEIPVLLA